MSILLFFEDYYANLYLPSRPSISSTMTSSRQRTMKIAFYQKEFCQRKNHSLEIVKKIVKDRILMKLSREKSKKAFSYEFVKCILSRNCQRLLPETCQSSTFTSLSNGPGDVFLTILIFMLLKYFYTITYIQYCNVLLKI